LATVGFGARAASLAALLKLLGLVLTAIAGDGALTPPPMLPAAALPAEIVSSAAAAIATDIVLRE
jgi:hypothetical protein